MTPFGYIYGVIADFRNTLYKKGVFKSHSLGVKTVSIGNITVGGTGKTPLVALVSEILSDAGEKVCILTRGYGRKNSSERVLVSDGRKILSDVYQSGDEPFELAQRLSEKAVIIADADRVSAGHWAREKFNISAFILDDAFQHQRVKRDINIVCVDAMNPFGNGRILPAGILRESLKNLSRADMVVITRANLVENIASLKSEIAKHTDCPIFLSHNRFSKFIEITDSQHSKFNNKDKTSKENIIRFNVLAFCALGNPGNFFEQLKLENFNLSAVEIFPDHHFYTQRDFTKIKSKATESGAEIAMTTFKDSNKLKVLKLDFPVFAAKNDIIFDKYEEFINILLS